MLLPSPDRGGDAFNDVMLLELPSYFGSSNLAGACGDGGDESFNERN